MKVQITQSGFNLYKIFWWVCLIFITGPGILNAIDSSQIDSIRQLVVNAKTVEERVVYLHSWCRMLRYGNEADSVSLVAVSLIPKIENDSLIGRTWFTHATILRLQFLYDSADVYYHKALNAFKKSDDSDMEVASLTRLAYSHIYRRNDGYKADSIYKIALEIAHDSDVDSTTFLGLYQGRGNALQIQSRFSESIEQFLIGEQYLDTSNYPWVKTFYANFAAAYKAMSRTADAETLYNKVLESARVREDHDGMAFCLRSLGHLAVDDERYDEAEQFFLDAIRAFEKAGDTPRVSYTTSELAQVYGKQGRLEESYAASVQTLELARKTGLKYEEAWSLAMIGFYHNAKGNPREGQKNCEEAWEIIRKENNRSTFQIVCECLVESYEMQGIHGKALEFYRRLQHFQDSLSVDHQEREIAQVEAKYQIEKERELANLEKEKQQLAFDSNLTRQKNIRNLLLLGLLALACILYILWRAYMQRKQANQLLADKNAQIQKALSERELLLKEIHHRVKNNLQVVTSLLNLQSSYIEDKGALEAINEGRDRVQSMALIHQNLYREDNLTGIEIRIYFEKLIDGLFESYNIHPERIKLQMNIQELNLDVDTVIPLGLVVNELVSNALKYAFPNERSGTISILLSEENEHLHLTVSDDGIGMQDEWKEENDTFGYQLIHAFKEKLEATLSVDNAKGTAVTMSISDYQKAS